MVGPQQTLADTSTMLKLLADQRRRHALDLLSAADRPRSVAALASDVADREREESATSVERPRTEDLRIELYHVHLPMLAESGLIEFDRDRKTATLARSLGTVDGLPFSP
ncbi:hypothetical protein [Halovivax sp.]|uniref:DUF7344 domain-containing protein n=1 Tax=Halovivax sp. TaxID=1935978 RepID=UPI0025BF17CB|nr:hypothetical protein [Halovivax sp.]